MKHIATGTADPGNPIHQVKLIKSAINGYEEALRRGTTIYGHPLSTETKAKYSRKIVILQGELATILGGMPL